MDQFESAPRCANKPASACLTGPACPKTTLSIWRLGRLGSLTHWRSTLTRSPFRLTRTPHSAASLMMVAALKGRPPNHRLTLRLRPEARLVAGNAQPWAYLSAWPRSSSPASERGQFATTVSGRQFGTLSLPWTMERPLFRAGYCERQSVKCMAPVRQLWTFDQGRSHQYDVLDSHSQGEQPCR